MVKQLKNLKNFQKITFFLKKIWKLWEKKISLPRKNAILLVLPIENISLQPELSSPANFRIQGGSPERDTGAGRVAGR